MKFFIIFIFLFINSVAIFSHPIIQSNFTIKIKNNREYEITVSTNLAFLLCQNLISDFEKYEKEYKRLICLSNEDFLNEINERKKDLLTKFAFGFNDVPSENSIVDFDLSLRKQQDFTLINISENLNHSDALSCIIILKGRTDQKDVTNFYWENIDPVKINMLKVYLDDSEEFAVLWVNSFDKNIFSFKNPSVSTLDVIKEYTKQGFLHIIPVGLDHVLFMLCLFLLFSTWKSLLLQISVFTIAHSITLALVSFQVFSFKASYAEPLIALSICVVGVENLFFDKVNKYRLIIIFIFGLLHGMGFASALANLGLPENKLLVSLVSFNVGVELGQITIVTIAYLIIGHWFYKKDWYHKRIAIPCSIIISIYAFYLFVTRLPIF